MMSSPETRPSLLLRLQDTCDQQAWAEFLEIYQPLIRRLARRRGLQEADAGEVTQEVLLTVVNVIGRWENDPARGSFRAWLATITRNLVVNFLIRQSRHPRASGDSDLIRWLDEVPDENHELSALFDLEERRRLFHWAASKVKKEFQSATWQAFWLTSVESLSSSEVASRLQLSVGAVHVARSRVMKRLREKIETLKE